MPVPTSLNDLSTTPASNFPAGSESPSVLDDTLRAHAALMATLRDNKLNASAVSAFGLTLVDDADAAAARGTLGVREAIETWQPGDVKWQAHNQGSPGWVLCDGAALSRTTSAALFAAIGTTWGAGDGSTTFNVPNLQNRMAIGSGSLYSLGTTGGSKDAVVVAHTHTGTTNNDGNHAHTLNGYSLQAGDGVTPSAVTDSNTRPQATTTATGGAHSHAFTTASSGVSGTDANLPPYAALRAVIKL